MSKENIEKNALKPKRGFAAKSETVAMSIVAGLVALLFLGGLAFAIPQAAKAVTAYKEMQGVYQPAGKLLTVRKVPLTPADYETLVLSVTSPDVVVKVEKSGLQLSMLSVRSFDDYERWRAALDRAMLQMPDVRWTVEELCINSCQNGHALSALLKGEKTFLDKTGLAPGKDSGRESLQGS